jgi:outer membrane lipoprotein-sorting protein
MITNMKLHNISIVLLLTFSGFFSTQSNAQDEDQASIAKGFEIATEAEKRDTGFGDQISNMEMKLQNKHGDKSIRHVLLKTLEVIGDGDKSMSIFNKPADIKGTAFLTFSHSQTPDEQWLYLPALKRVKRINSKNKSGPFMGSEFAYEDIGSQELDKYTYKYIRDEKYNDIDCFVIERYPAYKHSGYTRQIAWINKSEYRPEKIVYYDRKNSLLKTLAYSGYEKFLGQYWRPGVMQMDNHQTEKNTTLTWSGYKFKTGLKDKDFSRNSLKRAK